MYMRRIIIILSALFLLIGVVSVIPFSQIEAQSNDRVVVDFFYSPTCPHCHTEGDFLDTLEGYDDRLVINRYIAADEPYRTKLYNLLEKKDAIKYFGSVPVTFINEDYYFLGFDNAQGMGQTILAVIDQELAKIEDVEAVETISQEDIKGRVSLPFLGQIDTDNYSLPVLAVVMGLLDGFNVCSLGALVLILGLVMSLRSRRMIATFGGIFILATALIYGLLIVLWYHLFDAMAPYISSMELVIGLLALAGAVYFLKEYWRIKKLGATCEAGDNRLISNATKKIQKVFDSKKSLLVLAGAVLTFAAIVTIVEFPCSAAVPVVFAGVLADSGVSTIGQFGYIGLFTLFYMFDELLIFAISVYKMNIWLTSPRFSKWFALGEGVILFLLGSYYILSLM